MGYYSRHQFYEINNGVEDDLSQEVEDFIDSNKDNDDDCEQLSYAMEESCKFYEQVEVMKRFSLEAFPDRTFCVIREGEESGDMEKSYYKNGMMASYRPKIVWTPFDEKDLK